MHNEAGLSLHTWQYTRQVMGGTGTRLLHLDVLPHVDLVRCGVLWVGGEGSGGIITACVTWSAV